jgi:hypothetical protein
MLAATWEVLAALAGLATVAIALIAWRYPRHPIGSERADVGVNHIKPLPGRRYDLSLFNRGSAHATHVHAFIDYAGVKTTFDSQHLTEVFYSIRWLPARRAAKKSSS